MGDRNLDDRRGSNPLRRVREGGSVGQPAIDRGRDPGHGLAADVLGRMPFRTIFLHDQMFTFSHLLFDGVDVGTGHRGREGLFHVSDLLVLPHRAGRLYACSPSRAVYRQRHP